MPTVGDSGWYGDIALLAHPAAGGAILITGMAFSTIFSGTVD